MMATVSAAWNAQLNTFLDRGGVIVVCDDFGGSFEVLDGPGLLTIPTEIGTTFLALTITTPGDPVAAGVVAYTAPNGSNIRA
jgi:hypothetical protein